MKDMPACEGAACKPRGACRERALTCVRIFLYTLVCILTRVSVGLLFHTELGFLERPVNAEQYCSAFFHQHLSKESVESHLFRSAGIFIYWDAARHGRSRQPRTAQPRYTCPFATCCGLWPSLRFSVLSTLDVCCSCCRNLQHKDSPLKRIWGF